MSERMSENVVRLTYAELARARGITVPTARRMTLRHRWPKQVGNDGLTRILVPADAVPTAGEADGGAGVSEAVEAPVTSAATVDATAAVRALGDAVAALGAQLIRERERADRAEARLRELGRGWKWWRRPDVF
jgi:hypothetical protein